MEKKIKFKTIFIVGLLGWLLNGLGILLGAIGGITLTYMAYIVLGLGLFFYLLVIVQD